MFAEQEEVHSLPEENTDVDLKKQARFRSAYEADQVGYGGRTSVGKQLYRDDVFGLAVNYSEPVNEGLREQTTMETFLKIKRVQNIAITPLFQWRINP